MQARCGTTISFRGQGQGVNCGTLAFHCARRCRVFDRDIFRFGTAMTISFFDRSHQSLSVTVVVSITAVPIFGVRWDTAAVIALRVEVATLVAGADDGQEPVAQFLGFGGGQLAEQRTARPPDTDIRRATTCYTVVDHREPWVTGAIWNAKARMTDETGTLARSAGAVERSAKLAEPIRAELAPLGKSIRSIPTPCCDHRQHQDPALAEQAFVDTGIVLADLFGRRGEVEFGRPPAARLRCRALA